MSKTILNILMIFILSLLPTACIEIPESTETEDSKLVNLENELDYFAWPQSNYELINKCDFGSINCAKEGEQHTGMDSTGSEQILSSGQGIVARIVLNDGKDHGFGNTVIIKHCLENEILPIFTLYAHLDSISDQLSEGVYVQKGENLGIMGASGYGDPLYWAKDEDDNIHLDWKHLHFEFKNSSVLGDPKTADGLPIKYPEGKYFGYISNQAVPDPTDWGYRNPNEYVGEVNVSECPQILAEEDSKQTPINQITVFPSSTPVPTIPPTDIPVDSGQWIAYVGPDENIWLVDLDKNRKQLTFDGIPGVTIYSSLVSYRGLKWSPDGRVLSALRTDENGTKIIAIDIQDFSTQILLTNTEGSYDWLPDSESIVFSTIPYPHRNTSPGGLSLLDINSGEMTILLDAQPDTGYIKPDWASKGEYIYFSIQPAPVPDVIWGDSLGLASISNKNIKVVKNSAYNCDWNPDGQSLVCRSGSAEILCSALVIYSTSGDKLNEIKPGAGCTQTINPKWSPDGQWIVFFGEVGSQRGTFLIRKDGGDLIQLGENSSIISQPHWSPDSQMIAFLYRPDDNVDLVIVDIQNGQLLNLTNSAGDERGVAWQP